VYVICRVHGKIFYDFYDPYAGTDHLVWYGYGRPATIKTISILITFSNVLLDKLLWLSYHAVVLHDDVLEVLLIKNLIAAGEWP